MGMRLYLDASAIIYGIEGIASVRQAVLDRVLQAENEVSSAVWLHCFLRGPEALLTGHREADLVT